MQPEEIQNRIAEIEAVKVLSEVPDALHLRTLQSINDISSDQSNTVVFTVPFEILNPLKAL